MKLPKLRFSLRTMLVLVTLVCVICNYLGWAMNWIKPGQVFQKASNVNYFQL
jgi:hypothetical protein